MAVALYMDVHIPQAISEQLRRRGVDVVTAIDDEANQLPDEQLLERATQLSIRRETREPTKILGKDREGRV